MDELEKHFLKRIIRIWMRQIESRFSDNWNLSEVERAHYAGKHRAYSEMLEILEGAVPIGIPASSSNKKKNKDKT